MWPFPPGKDAQLKKNKVIKGNLGCLSSQRFSPSPAAVSPDADEIIGWDLSEF